MEKCKVLNKRWFSGALPANAVYCGRGAGKDPGKYGNPYIVGADGNRDEVIAKFEAEFMQRLKNPTYEAKMMADLDGKDLVCWCKDKIRFVPCHCDVILREVGKRSKHPERYCS
jgi:hypothetical protein